MLELRRGDEITLRWPEGQLIAALQAFWGAVLEEGMLYDRWHRTRLFIPGRGDVAVPENQRRELSALGVRRSEPGFLAALAAQHAQLIDQPLVLSTLLDIAPTLPKEVQRVVEVLRKALNLTEPLRHLGLRGGGLPSNGASFTLLEEHGAHPNGAGTVTWASAWELDVPGPVRLQVAIESEDEEGRETSWSTVLRAVQGTPIEPLVDAFKEQGLWVRSDFVSLD